MFSVKYPSNDFNKFGNDNMPSIVMVKTLVKWQKIEKIGLVEKCIKKTGVQRCRQLPICEGKKTLTEDVKLLTKDLDSNIN